MLSIYASVGCLAGIGAVCRFGLDSLINAHRKADFPYATWIINALACFMAGIAAASMAQSILDSSLSLYITTGFLGGFSTFSTAMVEPARLVEDKRYGQMFILILGMLTTCTLCYLLGWNLIG